MLERIWIYEAQIVRHIDGDTTVMDVDQGMNQWARNQYVRYAGINAPEMRGPSKASGQAALDHLEGIVPVGTKVWLATVEYNEFEKFGRVLAVVYTAPPTSFNWADAQMSDLLPGSVNQEMINSGNAVPFMQ